ncbi:MAG: methylated-DNA--[protein]-cysteine S-methyltransferase [Mycobacteriales bacterium]
MVLRHAYFETKDLGRLTLVAVDAGLRGLYFPHHWHRPPLEAFGRPVTVDGDALFVETVGQLNEYLAGKRTAFDIATAAVGNPFQEQVWALLNAIPYGETTTYGVLAERLGDALLAQQVGQAVGRNPLSIIVPCHRVVGAAGQLTGYAGGLERKQFLLDLEEPAEAKAAKLF